MASKRAPTGRSTDGISRGRAGGAAVLSGLPIAEVSESDEIVPKGGEVNPLRTIGIGELGLDGNLSLGENSLEA